jgi:uncharacterized protein (TIGR03086 family)
MNTNKTGRLDSGRITEAVIEADPDVPIIRITRDFAATPSQLLHAHLDPDLFVRWVGPDGMETRIVDWDVRDGGSWRYVASRDGVDFAFRGCFHQITDRRIVQTFTFEGMPDDVALETLTVEDLGDGRTRLHAQSLVDSFAGRDAWLASGMETGVNEGYAKLDSVLAGAADSPADRFRRVAGRFTQRVGEVPADAWANAAPCAGWDALDVVRHLVEWIPGVIGRSGLAMPDLPSVDDDPVGAWRTLAAALQGMLDDPQRRTVTFDGGPPGQMTVEQAIDRLVTADVLVHTWDLARATGLDERLDESVVAEALAGMEPIDELLRASGHFGPKVEVPADADMQTRLIAFTGRQPG